MTEEHTPKEPGIVQKERNQNIPPRRDNSGPKQRPHGHRPPRPRPNGAQANGGRPSGEKAAGSQEGKPRRPDGQQHKKQGQSAQPSSTGREHRSGVPAGKGQPAPGQKPPQAGQPGQPQSGQKQERPPQRKPGAPQAGERPAGAAAAPVTGGPRPPQAHPRGAQKQRPPRPAGEPTAVRSKAPEVREEPEEVFLQYRAHEMKKRPRVAALLLAAIVFVIYIAYSVYPNVVFVAVSSAIMVFSVSYFLFPITYKLTNKGVHMRNFVSTEFRTWDKFYDYSVYPDAIQLLFDYRTIRGRVQKGFLVYFDQEQEQKDKLLNLVKSRIKKPEKQPKPGTPPVSNDKPAPVEKTGTN